MMQLDWHSTRGLPMTQGMEQCPACGSAVPFNEFARSVHENWHAKIEEQVLYPPARIDAVESQPGIPQATETGSAGGVTIHKEPA